MWHSFDIYEGLAVVNITGGHRREMGGKKGEGFLLKAGRDGSNLLPILQPSG